MSDIEQLVAELAEQYGDPSASTIDLLCRRHPSDAVAFTVIEPDLSTRDLTFGELDEASGRFAAGLASVGVGQGDRVATLMGKSAELVIAVLGIWRLGAVQVPLFTAFAPPAIELRTKDNGTKAIVVDQGQREKLDPGGGVSEDHDWTIITNGEASGDDVAFDDLLAGDELAEPVAVGGNAPIVEIYTSGTTGSPKGVPVPLSAVASFHGYQAFGLDHAADDVFWNAADPGWAYGLYFAIIGPLALGHRALLLHSGFSPELTWQVLAELGVTNFAAGPTVYRALRNAEVEVPSGLQLRHCSSAGEPLTPEVNRWTEEALGVSVRDHYGQTETGMTVGNAWHPELIADIKPGSMGRPLPGWQVEVLAEDADEVAPTGTTGRLAIEVAESPFMWFTGYRDAPERTAQRYSPDGRWYLTGDVAAKDADGYITFGSRDDDIILMAGYRIGPFEVEGALLQHPAVADVAVVGEPDELRGEVVVAHVVTHPEHPQSDDLAEELKGVVKTELAAHVFPRRIYFVDALPKTPSGKLQRYQLRPPE